MTTSVPEPTPTPAPATPAASGGGPIAAAVEHEFAAAEHLLAAHKLGHIPHPHLARRAAAGPVKTADQLPAGGPVARFNTRVALLITRAVGSMWCAYLFAALDLFSLPAAVRAGTATIVTWVAQTFLQLVLLSVIMVGQNVQAGAADARARATFDDGEAVLHYADSHAKSLAELHLKVDSGVAKLHDKLDDEMYGMHRRLDQLAALAATPPAPAAAPTAAAVLDEHTAAELAKQLGEHLDKIAQGGNVHVTAAPAGSAAAAPATTEPDPAPAAAPAPPTPLAAPSSPPADGPTGSASTS